MHQHFRVVFFAKKGFHFLYVLHHDQKVLDVRNPIPDGNVVMDDVTGQRRTGHLRKKVY